MEPTTVAFFSSVIIFAVRLASIPASTVWQVAGPLAWSPALPARHRVLHGHPRARL